MRGASCTELPRSGSGGAAAPPAPRFRDIPAESCWLNTCSALRFTPTKPDVGSCTVLPRIGRSTARKKRIPMLAHETGSRCVRSTKREPITISQPDVLQRFEHARNIGGIVLAVAIHANHISIAQFVGQFVSGLHRAAEAQMMRQRQALRRRPGARRRPCHRANNRRRPAPALRHVAADLGPPRSRWRPPR